MDRSSLAPFARWCRAAVACASMLTFAAVGPLGCGAAAPMVTTAVVGHPSAPAAARVTNVPIDIGNGRVFVVTPSYLEMVAPVMVGQTDKLDEGYAEAVDSGQAVIPEYRTVASAFERHLLDGGLQPISEDTLTTALSDASIASRFESLAAEQGGVTLLQLAMEVGPRIDASLALLVRSSQVGYTDRPVAMFPATQYCQAFRIQPLEVTLDTALVSTETGDILWSGEATVRASDLLPEPVTFPRGPERAQFTRAYGPVFVIQGQDDGERCAVTSIAGYFCMEWGSSSGSCQSNQEPSYPESNAYVIDETVRQLVGYMTPLFQSSSPDAPPDSGKLL